MHAHQLPITIIEGIDSINTLIPFIATQRITMFKQYPYLYQGTSDGEYEYLSWFAQLPTSTVAVAYDGEIPIGFLTGSALIDFESHFHGSADLFRNAGLDSESYYYFGEVIVLPAYRDNSICRHLFAALEQHARDHGFSAVCFTCEQHEQHPLKPANYKELGPLFTKLGYSKTGLTILFDWDTIQPDGSIAKMFHPLTYWMKDL